MGREVGEVGEAGEGRGGEGRGWEGRGGEGRGGEARGGDGRGGEGRGGEGRGGMTVIHIVRSLRSIFCPDRDTPDKSTKLGTSLHKLFIIHSGWGCPG